jgi:hypothetical protein
MAAPGKWKVFRSFKKYLLPSGGLGIDPTASIKAALFLSTSNANDLTQSTYGALTNEVAQAFGYLTGGVALTTVSWVQTGSLWTLDFDDPTWNAAGGDIVARFCALYVNATINAIVKPLIAVSLLNTAPADVTGVNGNPLILQIAAGGALTLDGAETD